MIKKTKELMKHKNFISVILIIGVIFFSASAGRLFAQDNPTPTVELPDFVITGTDVVNVQSAQKIKPEVVSTVSEGFLKPAFSPEELEVRDLSNPVKDEINLFDTLNFLKGDLKAGVGVYTLPHARLRYAYPFNSGIINARGYTLNKREHVDNSGKFTAGGSADLSLFIDNEASFLPGTQFKFFGGYDFSSYKFYASPDPAEKRTYHNGSFGLKMNNLLSDIFIFGAEVSDEISTVQDETFDENLLNINGFAKLELANFNLTANVNYKSQSVQTDTVDGRFGFIAFRPTIGLVFSEVLKAFFGFNYAHVSSNNFFSPYASIALKLDKNLALYGQFTPQAEFYTAGNFIKENPYFNVQDAVNIFIEKQGLLKASIKYEYDKYFEIDGGVEYSSSENMPYYTDTTNTGKFNLATENAKSFTGFLNLLFHPGPFGIFYGNVIFNSTTNSEGNFLPYHPVVKGTLVYGYDFNFGLNARARLEYNSKTYADISNTKETNSYIDLGLSFAYKVADNLNLTFDFSNLLGNENYRWFGYKETPLDIVAGINYKW